MLGHFFVVCLEEGLLLKCGMDDLQGGHQLGEEVVGLGLEPDGLVALSQQIGLGRLDPFQIHHQLMDGLHRGRIVLYLQSKKSKTVSLIL